ncbi:MAG: sulfite exporter TauE/SafE family protein [Gemmatimonadales bacterium]
MTTPARDSRRSILAFAIPVSVVWTGWLFLMSGRDLWHLFATNWFMSVTMAFGSFVAGATSEGGGAVAFPVMTLVFGISPTIARDFSLMIQTVGMNAAAFAIVLLGIPVEWRVIRWASLGGTLGIVFGLEFVTLAPARAKMLFVSTWLAFAVALYLINRYRDREVHRRIQAFRRRDALLLLATGIVGGIVSSVTGSGLDITTFAVIVLYMSLSEKVATPTSVILMGLNAGVGFLYRGVFGGGAEGISTEAWGFWYVCVPIVVVGAPLGSWFIRGRSRLWIAGFLYLSIAAQYIWALIVLDVPRQPRLAVFSLVILTAGAMAFLHLARAGRRRLERNSVPVRAPSG